MGVGRWLIGISCLILPTLSATLHHAQAAEPDFADSTYVGSVTIGGTPGACESVTLASLPVDVEIPSRIYAYGSGVYHQNGGDLNVVSIHIALQANGATIAVSNEVPITAPYSGTVDPNNGNAFGAVSGVLQTGNDPSAIGNGGGAPFLARPGSYNLNLILVPASFPCPQQSFIGFVSLSYIVRSR